MSPSPAVRRIARSASQKFGGGRVPIAAARLGQDLPGNLGVVQSVNLDGTLTVVENGTPVPCYPAGGSPQDGDSVIVVHFGEQQAWAIPTLTNGWIYVGSPTGPAFAADWSNVGGIYQLARFRRVGDMVQLGGFVQIASGGGNTVFVLPAGYTPLMETLLSSYGSPGAQQINISPSGVVNFPGVLEAGWQFQLDGVSFPIT